MLRVFTYRNTWSLLYLSSVQMLSSADKRQTRFSSVNSVAKLINNFRHVASIFILSPLFQVRKLTNLCGCTQSSWRKAALIDCWHIWMKHSQPKGAEGKSRVSLLLVQCFCLCWCAALYASFKRLKCRWQSHLCRIKTMHSDLKIPIKLHVNRWEEPEEEWGM